MAFSGVYRSVSGGKTWRRYERSEISAGTAIQQIGFSPNFRIDRTVLITVRGKDVMRVTLSAKNWAATLRSFGATLLNQNVAFTELRSPNFPQDSTILGRSNDAVYHSTDGGENWALTGIPGTN